MYIVTRTSFYETMSIVGTPKTCRMTPRTNPACLVAKRIGSGKNLFVATKITRAFLRREESGEVDMKPFERIWHDFRIDVCCFQRLPFSKWYSELRVAMGVARKVTPELLYRIASRTPTLSHPWPCA